MGKVSEGPHEAECVAEESPGMRDKVIDGNVNSLPCLDIPQCCDHQIVVERIWTGRHSTTQHNTHVFKATGEMVAKSSPGINRELNTVGL